MRAKAVPAPLFRFVSFSVAAMLSFVAVCAVGVPEATAAEPTYYVSLGDSLAAGYQPDTRKDEPVSYTDDLFATLRASDPNLQHIRLGCSGESTATMINGGRCTYDGAPSQLDAATKFITAHRGQVRYVTEDLGARTTSTPAFAAAAPARRARPECPTSGASRTPWRRSAPTSRRSTVSCAPRAVRGPPTSG